MPLSINPPEKIGGLKRIFKEMSNKIFMPEGIIVIFIIGALIIETISQKLTFYYLPFSLYLIGYFLKQFLNKNK